MWAKMHNMHAFFELPPHKDKFLGCCATVAKVRTAASSSYQGKTKRSVLHQAKYIHLAPKDNKVSIRV